MGMFNRRGEGGKRGGSPAAALGVFALTAALVALTWKGFPSQGDSARAKALEKAAAALPSSMEPLSLAVARDADGGLRARLSFHDLGGAEISVLERSIPEGGIVLDCWLVNPSGQARPSGSGTSSPGFLLFPRRLRGAAEPFDGGTALFESYARSGFPAIFEGGSATGKEGAKDDAARKALQSLFASLSRAESASSGIPSPGLLPAGVKGLSGLALVLADPEPGAVYNLVIKAGGRLSLSREAGK